MFSISFLLFVCVTATFADPFFPNINEGNARIVPQQVPQQSDQLYSSSAPQLFMERNQNSFPILQQGMMQGFQSPFPVNPLNQQQLSLLMMSTFAKMMALTQLMTMQNRYQPFSQYSDPAMNNFGQTPVPLPYVQQPQAETQNNLRNEMLQQQQQQAETQNNLRNEMLQQQQQQAETQNNLQNEMLKQQKLQADSQKRAILEERIKREFDMEVQRHEELLKRKAEEEELEQTQKIIERQLRDEQEIEKEKREAKRQILEEEREEQEKKENDRKLREKEELRSKLIDEEKLKQIQRTKLNMRPTIERVKKPCKPKFQLEK